MECKHCIENGKMCEYLQKRPIMAETSMDSGVYVQTGWYYKCLLTERIFHSVSKDLEYQQCVK